MPLEMPPQVVSEKPQNRFVQNMTNWQELLHKKGKVADKDRMFFTEQLSLMLETGASLPQALTTLKAQSDNPAMAYLIDDLMNNITEGNTFSYALSLHPEVFSTTYINLVAASERGGFMHQVLTQLQEMEQKREELRNTLVSSFSYPAFLVFFSFAVVVFVLVVVFPKFGDMFASIEDQLPATTIGLMAASNILTQYWIFILGGIMVCMLFLRYWLKSPDGIRYLDSFKLGAPVLKDVFIKLYLVQSLRVMSLSLRNGVSVMDTLAACKGVVRNTVYQQFINDVEAQVQEGAGLAVGFNKTDFIPPIAEQMITTGEETGNLPKVMGRIADYYERQLSKNLKALSKLAEPIMLLVMGVVVGVLVSSLILPIFKLSRAVS